MQPLEMTQHGAGERLRKSKKIGLTNPTSKYRILGNYDLQSGYLDESSWPAGPSDRRYPAPGEPQRYTQIYD